MFSFGAALAAVAPEAFDGGSVEFITEQAGFASAIFLLAIVLAAMPILGVDIYGAFVSATTISCSLSDARKVTQRGRMVAVLVITAVATLLSILGRATSSTTS